jgi:hypothetical protein
MAKTWISENPDLYAYSSGKRLVKTVFFDWDHPTGRRAMWLYASTRIFLFIGTVVGIVLAWRSGWRIWHYGLIAGVALLTYALTVTAARFAVPLEPLQLALCGLVIATMLRVRQDQPRPTRVVGFLGSRGTNDGTI